MNLSPPASYILRRSRRAARSLVHVLLLSMAFFASAATPAAAPRVATFPAAGNATFIPVDVYLDSGKTPLAAYQLEVTAKDCKIVGLEGGEPAAFKMAPYYDPQALQGDRIIVAAFSTANALPNGLTRVARLHLLATGPLDAHGLPQMTEKLTIATDAQGNPLDAKLELRALQGEAR